MAPTKKGKGKKAVKSKKVTVLDEEKYKKIELEVDTLKKYLVLRENMARQAMAASEELKEKLADLEKELEKARGDKKDIYEEMIRQYQQLQRQADTQIQRLEDEKKDLQDKLAACQKKMQQNQDAAIKMLEEKDKAIAEMQRKINEMEIEYEKILQASLDQVLSKMQTSKLNWEKEATGIHTEYKDRLKEFGLRPLEL